MVKKICFPFLFMVVLTLFSCQKKDLLADRLVNGTWVSVDGTDTIVFVDDHVLTKPSYGAITHNFEYSFGSDSITIRYSGPNKILIMPSAHSYVLDNNKLIIDFSNGCYGFETKKMTFVKQ